MSVPTTSKDTHNATSSPESAGGATPCDSQDGPMTDLFGQVVVPASHSASQVKTPSNQMSATYGRIGLGSSESVALQRYLASRLQARLPLAGGMMWPQIWKRKVSPALRRYSQLALSALRTGGTDYGLWQTPVADDAIDRKKGKYNSRGEPKLSAQVKLWTTPSATDGSRGGTSRKR